jgi:PAS domain-containing protein
LKSAENVETYSIARSQGMAFYTWQVADNKVYGDPYLAELYGMPANELAEGVPVERILAIIVDEDRSVIAGNVHRAIVNGEPSSGRFRVVRPNGNTLSLVSFGRCLHDETGVPTFYTGAVMPASSAQVAEGDDALEAHCGAALALAQARGNDLAVRYLSSAMNVISPASTVE